jgi:hypothetical protein
MSDNATAVVSESTAPNSKTKITTKDPALKLAHKRLTVLQLAESLGNVSEACRRGRLDHSGIFQASKVLADRSCRLAVHGAPSCRITG